MEFKFPVTHLFHDEIVEVNHTLIPPGFRGDRRAVMDATGKVSEIVNAMGEASAAAQGLTTPITTADRLRNSEHTIYLLIDQQANTGRGAVTGMLKTGKKSLYLFDRNGQYYHVSPTCVLDFYVHESRQRMGLGKQLYEHMLQKEHVEPVQMAIDRPSEKFLGFLNKYYSLNDPVKQMNNYVVFDDFFPKVDHEPNGIVDTTPESNKKESANGLQAYASPLGRYGARKPPCSMGQIIHNQTSTIQNNPEPTGSISMPEIHHQSPNPDNAQNVSNPNSQEILPESGYQLQQQPPQQQQQQINSIPNNFQAYYNYANIPCYNLPQSINYLPPQQQQQQQIFSPSQIQIPPVLQQKQQQQLFNPNLNQLQMPPVLQQQQQQQQQEIFNPDVNQLQMPQPILQQPQQQQIFSSNVNQLQMPSQILQQPIMDTNEIQKSHSSPQLLNVETQKRQNFQWLPNIQQSVPHLIPSQLPYLNYPYQQQKFDYQNQCGGDASLIPQTNQFIQQQNQYAIQPDQKVCVVDTTIEETIEEKHSEQELIETKAVDNVETIQQQQQQESTKQPDNVDAIIKDPNLNATGDFTTATEEEKLIRCGYPPQLKQ